ncbi:MAG: hypothetical protein PUB69_02945 [Desulfovibrionaceae bacterium]|nr:hypothetical protein [Desulfovibrionaceae bacterium]
MRKIVLIIGISLCIAGCRELPPDPYYDYDDVYYRNHGAPPPPYVRPYRPVPPHYSPGMRPRPPHGRPGYPVPPPGSFRPGNPGSHPPHFRPGESRPSHSKPGSSVPPSGMRPVKPSGASKKPYRDEMRRHPEAYRPDRGHISDLPHRRGSEISRHSSGASADRSYRSRFDSRESMRREQIRARQETFMQQKRSRGHSDSRR